MHSLAEQFCAYRHFWLLFFPLQVVVATSATLALLASSTNTTANNSNIQGHLSLSAGILGFVVSFLSALDRYTDYRSKAEMHRQAVVVYRAAWIQARVPRTIHVAATVPPRRSHGAAATYSSTLGIRK